MLLAVLISSILIALGSAIFDIVSKEIVLSSSGRESQFAFYAADTGIECALYWDKEGAFASTSSLTAVSCGGGNPATLTTTPDSPGNPVFTATFSFSFDGVATNPCTDVKVTRSYSPTKTTIYSYGHNTCVIANPLRLERAIQISY